jgi:predicted signal transduction protein with EAL and GGDEF domain
MPQPQDNLTASGEHNAALQSMHSNRVRQISTLIAIAALVLIPLYWKVSQWLAVGPLAAGAFMMLVCQLIDRKGHTQAASVTLVISLTVMSATLMWLDQGLRDASMLAFPVVLVLAGMLVSMRSFLAVLLVMIAFLLFMTMSTEVWGIRQDRPNDDPFDHVRDAITILAIGGWSVWFLVKDLRRVLDQLNEQIDMYRESQGHLTHLSRHDMLTDLPNRNFESEHIARTIDYAKRHNHRVALLFVDLDNFKVINDSLGHAVGDMFLKQVALRLQQSVRSSDMVSRHGHTGADQYDPAFCFAGNAICHFRVDWHCADAG